jgi:hypothetical protein
MKVSSNEQTTRRRATKLVIAFAVFVLGLAMSTVANAQGQDTEDSPTCTVRTLQGRYLFAWSGTVLPPAFGVAEPTAAGSAGYHTFNGDGTGTDTVTVRIGTAIVLEKVVAPITYTVNADCTGSYTVNVPGGPSFDLFIAPNGEEFATFATAPAGNQLASIDRRVSRK